MSRGGPNRGQGRKPLAPEQRRRPIQLRLAPDVLVWVDARANLHGRSRTDVIESLLRERMRGS